MQRLDSSKGSPMYRLLLLFALLWPVSALAAPTVDAQLQTALAQFEKGDAQGALTTLEAAEPQATGATANRIQFYKARCFIELNRPNDAKTALERYIAAATTKQDRERGRRWMAKVDRRFFGSIRCECSNAATKLVLQTRGQPKPQSCPAQWDGLSPGRYTLSDGKKTYAVEVVASKQVVIDLERDKRVVKDWRNEPAPMRFGWGGFVRAGSSLVEGTIDETAEHSLGATIAAGAFVDLIWETGAIDIGPRVELGYRNWQMTVSGNGRETAADTHGLIVPLMVVAEGPAGISLEAGGALELLLAGPEDVERDFSVSGLAGLGWALPVDWGRPRLSVRYLREFAGGLKRAADLHRHAVTAGLAFGL